jgi:nickel-dependent lactate racemase
MQRNKILTLTTIDRNEEIYEADVGGFSTIHERACELYQQIIGIVKLRENSQKSGKEIADQVYGEAHVKKNHRCKFYKPRYLRK